MSEPFERPHHRRIAQLLDALNGELLADHHCLFGGGTAAVLRHGEYRESVDVYFLVSDIDGYRGLRELTTDGRGIAALTQRCVHQLRDVRADQYGVRTVIEIDGEPIKFEIVHEGRIVLGEPGPDDQVCGVATLNELDMVTTKLLANADRWADRGVFSRDIIDLAMLAPPRALLDKAIAKAATAYGSGVKNALNGAIDSLRDNPHRLGECLQALKMPGTPPAVLWQRIRRLQTD